MGEIEREGDLELGIAVASVGVARDNVQRRQAQEEVADHQEVGLRKIVKFNYQKRNKSNLVTVGANLLETSSELLATLDAVLLHHLVGELGRKVTRLPHV